jgi:hypothetical protein
LFVGDEAVGLLEEIGRPTSDRMLNGAERETKEQLKSNRFPLTERTHTSGRLGGQLASRSATSGRPT